MKECLEKSLLKVQQTPDYVNPDNATYLYILVTHPKKYLKSNWLKRVH